MYVKTRVIGRNEQAEEQRDSSVERGSRDETEERLKENSRGTREMDKQTNRKKAANTTLKTSHPTYAATNFVVDKTVVSVCTGNRMSEEDEK